MLHLVSCHLLGAFSLDRVSWSCWAPAFTGTPTGAVGLAGFMPKRSQQTRPSEFQVCFHRGASILGFVGLVVSVTPILRPVRAQFKSSWVLSGMQF